MSGSMLSAMHTHECSWNAALRVDNFRQQCPNVQGLSTWRALQQLWYLGLALYQKGDVVWQVKNEVSLRPDQKPCKY